MYHKENFKVRYKLIVEIKFRLQVFYTRILIFLRLCLRVWRGREWKKKLKRNKQVEGVEKFERE
jgi:hypothetical protein